MAFACPAEYAEMLDAAKAGGYAMPSINVSSSGTVNAAIRGFVEAGSDGIVQMSTGSVLFTAGPPTIWRSERRRSPSAAGEEAARCDT